MSNLTTYDGTTLIMKTEKNFKQEKMLKFTPFSNFEELYEKSVLLKIAGQAFEAGDFINIFLSVWGFRGSFSDENFPS